MARNIAASLGIGQSRPYRHHDLGFLVDLGDRSAAANPFGVALSGLPAKLVTSGYHLYTLPRNRARIATEGFGARLLALQDRDGQWAGGSYFPGDFDFHGPEAGEGVGPGEPLPRAEPNRARDGASTNRT